MNIPLAVLEGIIDTSGVAARIEALLPTGVRHRQLRIRTLLLGMMLTLADRRPACLTGVLAALIALPGAGQERLGVTEDWKTGPHQLTYRQAERTFNLAAGALSKDEPDLLAGLARDGSALELAVGTGRVALPPSRAPGARRIVRGGSARAPAPPGAPRSGRQGFHPRS